MSDSIEYNGSPQLYGFPGRTKSTVWQDFGFYIGDHGVLDKSRAICRICQTAVKYSGNTTNLHTHLTRHYKASGNSTVNSNVASISNARIPIKTAPKWSIPPNSPSFRIPEYNPEDVKPIITEVFSNSSRVESLNTAIGEFLIGNMLPISMVESQTFLQLMGTADIHFNVPNRDFFADDFLSQKYMLMKLTLIDLMKNSETVAITTETWKSLSGNSYETYSVNLVREDWNFDTYVLSTEAAYDPNPDVQIKKTLYNWDLPSKPIVVTEHETVADNCASSDDFSAIFCLGKAINSAGNTVIESPSTQDVFRSVPALYSRFKEQNIDCNVRSNTCPSLKWMYMFEIIQELTDNKNEVVKLAKNNTDISDPTVYLKHVEGIYVVLKPLKSAVDMMCEQGYLTASMILPILRKLELSLTQNTADTDFVKELKNVVWTKLSQKYKSRTVRDFLLVASLLDPRFKDLLFVNAPERLHSREVISVVATEVYRSSNFKQEMVSSENGAGSYSVIVVGDDETDQPILKKVKYEKGHGELNGDCSPKSEDWLADVVGTTVSDPKETKKEDVVLAEVDCYVTMQQTTSSPFQWWSHREQLYPTLSRVAKRYLCSPATSLPANKLFNAKLCDDAIRRSTLPADHLNEYIFLNSNYFKLKD